MGDTLPHADSLSVLSMGVASHLASCPERQVLQNMILYYHPLDRWAYISPDLMVVKPLLPLLDRLASYRIGLQGPAPVLAVEVQSRRSFQQQDLTNKPIVYAELGVAEYLVVDVTGEFLPQRLLMKRLQNDQTWRDQQDADGGVTSELGFRVVIEADDKLRVIDAATGKRYLRPCEGQPVADALAQVEMQLREREERLKSLEDKLSRLRGGQEGVIRHR